MSSKNNIALLGFGEVGQVLASDLRLSADQQLLAYDIQFDNDGSKPGQAIADFPSVRRTDSADEVARDASLIIVAVTAGETLPALESILAGLTPGTFVLEVNSVSPATKQAAQKLIESANGRYIEAAIMSPIKPKRLAAPVSLGGRHANALLPMLKMLGFNNARTCSETVGTAAATKMCRSIIIKGMEALLTEALIGARHYQVEQEVLESLSNVLPETDWEELSSYMLSRSIRHGTRRAEEMREVAITVHNAGLEPHMSEAIAQRQDWAAGFDQALGCDSLVDMLDRIISENSTRMGDSQL